MEREERSDHGPDGRFPLDRCAGMVARARAILQPTMGLAASLLLLLPYLALYAAHFAGSYHHSLGGRSAPPLHMALRGAQGGRARHAGSVLRRAGPTMACGRSFSHFLPFVAYLFILGRKDAYPRSLPLLVPIMLFWVNVHGSFFLGVALLGIYGFGTLLERDRQRRRSLVAAVAGRTLAGFLARGSGCHHHRSTRTSPASTTISSSLPTTPSPARSMSSGSRPPSTTVRASFSTGRCSYSSPPYILADDV